MTRRAKRHGLCECGAPKTRPRDEACPQCRWLDGGSKLERLIVAALRGGHELSIYTLAELTGYTTRHVLRGLRALEARGRIGRREPFMGWGHQGREPAMYRLRDRRSVRPRALARAA